jgi:hypothetical protein
MKHCWEDRRILEKNCPNATLSSTNTIWTSLRSTERQVASYKTTRHLTLYKRVIFSPVCDNSKVTSTVLVHKLQNWFPPPPQGAKDPSGPGRPHYRGFTITLRHTTLGRTPLDEWSHNYDCWQIKRNVQLSLFVFHYLRITSCGFPPIYK